MQSQITNWFTYQMYLRQMTTLAENVFQFDNMPELIDISYVNQKLVKNGSIAFFVDEILGLIALPYQCIGKKDVYNRPVKIRCQGANGYRSKVLNPNEYVIMYDNNGRYPIYSDIIQLAERVAIATRTSDINIAQQKTNRLYQTSTDNVNTVRNIINNIDSFENEVLAYKNMELENISTILAPAPFVADKVDEYKERVFAEFLRLIGVSSLTTQKRERLITDEVRTSQGGTIASRFSRSQPRIKAVEEINEKFGYNISVSFYDGMPTSNEELDEYILGEKGDDSNDTGLDTIFSDE